MRRRVTWIGLAQLAVVLSAAVGLKAHYSIATVNQLRWILTPTTFLVELVTGSTFAFEPYAGYINREHTLVIAASCAGVNFLIACFLMLATRTLWRHRVRGIRWRFLFGAAGLAFLTTIVANTVRIAIALEMHTGSAQVRFLNAEQAHRLEGVLVYFGFLLLLFTLTDRTEQEPPARSHSARDVKASRFSRFLKATLFPLAIYYVTTLGMPFLNGAYRSAEFWEHSKFVVLAPIGLLLPLFVLIETVRRCRRESGPIISARPSRRAGFCAALKDQ